MQDQKSCMLSLIHNYSETLETAHINQIMPFISVLRLIRTGESKPVTLGCSAVLTVCESMLGFGPVSS